MSLIDRFKQLLGEREPAPTPPPVPIPDPNLEEMDRQIQETRTDVIDVKRRLAFAEAQLAARGLLPRR